MSRRSLSTSRKSSNPWGNSEASFVNVLQLQTAAIKKCVRILKSQNLTNLKCSPFLWWLPLYLFHHSSSANIPLLWLVQPQKKVLDQHNSRHIVNSPFLPYVFQFSPHVPKNFPPFPPIFSEDACRRDVLRDVRGRDHDLRRRDAVVGHLGYKNHRRDGGRWQPLGFLMSSEISIWKYPTWLWLT